MKKIKKLIFYSVFTYALLLGITSVDARTYTSYSSGDKVSVNVNDSTKLDFYVIEDSGSDSDEIKALAYNYANNNTYNFSEATSFINTLKTNWDNCISIAIPSAEDLLGYSVTLDDSESSINLTSPAWISPVTSAFTEYWVSNSPFDNYNSVVWGMDTYLNTQFSISVRKSTESIYVRPMIRIKKENVIGGVYLKELSWNDFVNKLQELVNNSESTNSLTSTSNSLKFTAIRNGQTYEDNYIYSN